MPDLVFVYGTLMDGFDGRRRAGVEGQLSWVGRGSIRARLFDLGEYPAAVVDRSRTVAGELYAMSDPEPVLAALDRFEGAEPGAPDRSLYTRHETEVTCDDGTVRRAWVYLYARPIAGSPVASGDYRQHIASRG